MRADSKLLKKPRKVSAVEEERIKEGFCQDIVPRALAKELKLSERTVYKRYKMLRGYPMRPHQIVQKANLMNRKKPKELEAKKPLINEARFYHSNFEPV